jgi:squalene-hopene/tetraprenyl-beta-curcumene cyclase
MRCLIHPMSFLEIARKALLDARSPAGHWTGELSSSALSTATAVTALEIVRRNGGTADETLVRKGVAWLRGHVNADGGFGDTVDSPSNLSTTTLAWAALGLHPRDRVLEGVEAWLKNAVGTLDAPSIAAAISARYGEDRTFSVPILTMCALAGRVPWKGILRLPFELAALPASLYNVLGLRVVSYALPALIAIGQAQLRHQGSWNPLPHLARKRTLRILERIQPASGGFLEAAPLTSFVCMSLAGSGLVESPVVKKAVDFLSRTVRADGSWPIDTNLATWVTTLAVNALGDALPRDARDPILLWLLGQQHRSVHPYTRAAPGGWAWTDLSGGVPDADDTPGALLALKRLNGPQEAARAGVRWLLDLQNRDGGIPTFCRGWGKLPFDRSCPDLTAHTLRAWHAWGDVPPTAIDRAFQYLRDTQRPDGSWIPLWFGNQSTPDQTNPVYGTSRVLLCEPLLPGDPMWARGRAWLMAAQKPDGGWGSIEETALAVEATGDPRGKAWLEANAGSWRPSPIGLYFAKLWYSEKLYPIIFTVAALSK